MGLAADQDMLAFDHSPPSSGFLAKVDLKLAPLTVECLQVRTKDRAFDSVSHLINFHRDNGLPIISAESALRLKNPVAHHRR